MSIPQIPDPAMLVISVLASKERLLEEISRVASELFGRIEENIGPLAFTFTSYYDSEMGSGIRRWLWAFSSLVDRGELAVIKGLTNGIEQAYTHDGKRMVNLDPGLITLGNFVLATGKNNAHRIYLSHGIFADLTLIFRKGSYQPLEWTYPDYADGTLIGLLNGLREKYKCKLSQMNR